MPSAKYTYLFDHTEIPITGKRTQQSGKGMRVQETSGPRRLLLLLLISSTAVLSPNSYMVAGSEF